MPDSFLDHLPFREREKIKRRMRSPEAYERLRETVKGPEDLEREMEKNAESADIGLSLETNRDFQEHAKERVQAVVAEKGIDAFVNAPRSTLDAIAKRNFEVSIDHTAKEPRLAIRVNHAPKQVSSDAPMGNVQEVYPLKTTISQSIVSSLKKNA